MQPVVYDFRQHSTALNQDVIVQCGFRPAFVIGWAGPSGKWIKVDGMGLGDLEARTFPDASGNIGDTNNVVSFHDNGFRLESSSSWIRVSNRSHLIIAFPPSRRGVFRRTLDSTIPVFVPETGGDQYTATDQAGTTDDWIARTDA